MGFDWSEFGPVWAKVREELKETEDAIEGRDSEEIESELGDLLFSLVNAARFLKLDPEEVLRKANGRFSDRFQSMEKRAKKSGRSLSNMSLDEMDRLWEGAKQSQRKHPKPRRR